MKKIIYKLGFTLISLFISCSLLAQEDSRYVIDSLSADAKNKTGEPKLIALGKLIELELFSTNVLSRLDDLEREAIAQENDRFLLYAYNSRIVYYLRNNNQDSINRYARLSVPIMRELDPTDSFATHHEFLKIINYTARGLFDLALISQKRYLDRIENIENVKPDIFCKIYIGIGDTYYHQEKYEEALKYFEQAKELMLIDDSPGSISLLYLLALCNINLENYTKAIEYCDLASSLINSNEKTVASENSTYLNFLAKLITIQAYSKLKDLKMAKGLIDQLPSDLDTSFRQGQDDYYYSTLAIYYSGIEEYDKALEYTELGLDHLKKTNNIIAQPAFIKAEASVLYNMQNYKKAYDKLLYATQFTDSIRNSHSTIQLDELAIMYEVDLKDAEIAKTGTQLKFSQTIIIGLIVISILLLAILLVVRINSKKQEEKNKILFKQHEKLNKSINYYKKMIVEGKNKALNVNPLFQKLEDYMLKEEVYKNPDISREDIASALKTNRQYLSSAIKDETGLTYTSYINKYRLENARKQLLENDEVVIDDIIIEAGFSSRPTFHRLFKEQYGMAPHELKRAAIALQNELKGEDIENL